MSSAADPKVQPKSTLEELSDFLNSLDTYDPTVPVALTKIYLERSGLTIKDERIVKLVSLAADKFLADVVHESKQISLLRQQKMKTSKRKLQMAETLEIEDLQGSLAQFRIFLRRNKHIKVGDE